MTQDRRILEKILNQAREARDQKLKFLAVFDLDSTLFDLTQRITEIVLQFAQDKGNRIKYPELCETIKKIKIEPKDWGIGEALTRLGLSSDVHPDFFRELHQHWAYWFFHNDFLHQDLPIPGAPQFVRQLASLGAEIHYLTGRDVKRMERGTRESLERWGFPSQGKLFLKPSLELDDAEFKLEVLRQEAENFDYVWLFENEPVNLNLIEKHLPKIQLVFLETTHSRRAEANPALDSIKHYVLELD